MRPLSVAEREVARRRFEQDQDDAAYVDLTCAMQRIGSGRRWRRRRVRFLRKRGYPRGCSDGRLDLVGDWIG